MSDTFYLCPKCREQLEADLDIGIYYCDNCKGVWQRCDIKPTYVEYLNNDPLEKHKQDLREGREDA